MIFRGALVVLTVMTTPMFTNNLSMPIIGVPLTTIAGAVLGTYGAIGYDDATRPRGRLFTRAAATTILACAIASVLPRFLGWVWVSGGVEGALAAIYSATIYYTMEPITKRLKIIIESVTLADILPFLRKTPPAAPPSITPPDSERSDKK